MGVYIKGMEMPKCCMKCRPSHLDPGCSLYCPLVEDDVGPDGQVDIRCPLVPVPPHGRLGDMDAIARKIRRLGDYVDFTKDEIAGWFENGDFETIIPAEPAEEGET